MSASRTVIVTGGNTGLGFHAATRLAADPSWRVVLACRDTARGGEAAEKIALATGNAAVEARVLDLGSLASVRAFTDGLAASDRPPLAALLCNAGLQVVRGLTLTVDGFETTFAVNHLGHLYLTELLLPRCAGRARVVFVSSGTHDPAQRTGMPAPELRSAAALARPDAADFRDPGLAGRRAYTTSKLCNVLTAYELSRRLAASGRDVLVNAFDPGLMPGSGLARDYGALSRFGWRFLLPALRLFVANVNSVASSGEALARRVTDPRLDGVSGRYFVGEKEERSSAESYDEAKAATLYRESMDLLASAAAPRGAA